MSKAKKEIQRLIDAIAKFEDSQYEPQSIVDYIKHELWALINLKL